MRQYYERNTQWFLLRGKHKQTRSIHRAVWVPGVSDLPGALNYTNDLIRLQLLELAQRTPGKTIRTVDLGCGVGGSLFYLASHMPDHFWGLGLTISPRQAQLARRHAEQLGLQHRCGFVEADFQRLPLVAGLEAAFSIEAFAHASDLEGYLREVAHLLCIGGRLILCDDFCTGRAEEDNFWLNAFRQGWHVQGLSSAEHVKELARSYGLEPIAETDLTKSLRLSRAPAWAAGVLVGVGANIRRLYWQSVIGGVALQECLKQGLVSYRFMVFERR